MSVYLILFLLSCIKISFAYFITVDAHAEECFFDKVPAKTKMGLMFEIAEGGFLDIDVKIIGPDGKIIYQGERESSGKYTFAADMDGVYTYCFSNQMSTMTPKIVMFNMEIEKPSAPDDINKDTEVHHNALEEMIKTLSATLTSVKHEQEYMQVRDRIHKTINESTNFRVVLWSFFEAVVLVAMTAGQIYYLKRYFEGLMQFEVKAWALALIISQGLCGLVVGLGLWSELCPYISRNQIIYDLT